jgi:hypothetical protein
METNYKVLEEAVYINQVEHEVTFIYKDKKIRARGQYYIGSMGFDELFIYIHDGDDFETDEWLLHRGKISEAEYDEIRELAEELIYEMEAPYNETIHHKEYSHE